MIKKKLQMSRELIDERKLELENRVRNLFWTVSGDYSLKINPNIYDFAVSKYIPLYDAIKQGAFAKFFSLDMLADYVMKKTYLGADDSILMELVQVCIDVAIYPYINSERVGVENIRRHAFRDILEAQDERNGGKRQTQELMYDSLKKGLIFSQLKYSWMLYNLGEEEAIPSHTSRMMENVTQLLEEVTTEDVVDMIDLMYDMFYDQHFVENHGDVKELGDVNPEDYLKEMREEGVSEADLDDLLKQYLEALKQQMLRLEIEDEKRELLQIKEDETQEEYQQSDHTTEENIRKYVDASFGKTYLRRNELERNNQLYCRGMHKDCRLHYTEGVLKGAGKKNNQYRYAELLANKNQMYYYENHWVVKSNIKNLADILKKTLTLKAQTYCQRDRMGVLVPSRLWKLNRTEDDRMFNKILKQDTTDFVVDVLMDASGSQMKRAPQVAVQGYIISQALSEVGIPHRVVSFCTFWEYTVLQRFRDYDDRAEKNTQIFQYQASAFNRDGLAIRAITGDLLNRSEEKKILIVLSDGRPNDRGKNSRLEGKRHHYVGEAAARDTAMEIRKARNQGVLVLGVFAGSSDDLATEKKIFGKDFAYIRNIGGFAHVVGKYLCKQIEDD